MLVPLLQELNWQLLWAAESGRTEEVKALLRQGAHIECRYWVRHVTYTNHYFCVLYLKYQHSQLLRRGTFVGGTLPMTAHPTRRF